MSDLLLARAAALHGTFTWADAHALGIRADELARMVGRTVVHRVGPRAYVLDDTVRSAATTEEKHRLKTLAVVRSFEDRVAASHHSALAVHGLPFHRVDHSQVHVCRISGTTSRRRELLTVHEAYPDGAVVHCGPTQTLTVTAALAVIGTAMTAGETAGVVAADAALHRGLATREELLSWLERLRRRPGLRAARRAVDAADGRSESVGETRTRVLLRALPDLPAITPQYELRDEHGVVWARVDLLVGEHLVVEFDGRVKHRADPGFGGSRPEDVVWAEKVREDRLRSEGKVVIRVIWSDLDRPPLVNARIRAGLDQVARLHGPSTPSMSSMPPSLGDFGHRGSTPHT